MKTALLAVASLVLVVVSGCASTSNDRAAGDTAGRPALEPRQAAYVDARSGSPVDRAEMLADLASADVVIVAERHGHPVGLPAAAELWQSLLDGASAGGLPALSLEFFDRGEQAHLDDFLLGLTDEEAFRKATGRTDGNFPEGHRAMVLAAKEAGARVYAANAPRAYTSTARTEGYDALAGLRPSQRALFELPMADGPSPYRERFYELFRGMLASHGGAGHGDGSAAAGGDLDERIGGFFRAQSVWDATMAETIGRAVSDRGRPVLHVVGQFHTDQDGGLLLELRARRPGLRVVTVSMVEEAPADGEPGRADYLMVVGPAEAGASGEAAGK